ncbi:hypothetical protein E2C01_014848 [Portunus trituberculatus]|uniref:Uncharacterized protein n=1 Tax=Portunus trituberculatus TaxID=210409 RepID=A0A5B7DLI7_PORTR|nr:hypothetical protein [Portunus trituberculatus]
MNLVFDFVDTKPLRPSQREAIYEDLVREGRRQPSQTPLHQRAARHITAMADVLVLVFSDAVTISLAV